VNEDDVLAQLVESILDLKKSTGHVTDGSIQFLLLEGQILRLKYDPKVHFLL
jgi:hypothetical protein